MTKVKASLAGGGKSIKVRHLSADKAIPLSIASPSPRAAIRRFPVAAVAVAVAVGPVKLHVARCGFTEIQLQLAVAFACRSTLLGATFEQLQAFVNKRIIHISWLVLLSSSSFIIFNDSKDDDGDVRCASDVLLLKN